MIDQCAGHVTRFLKSYDFINLCSKTGGLPLKSINLSTKKGGPPLTINSNFIGREPTSQKYQLIFASKVNATHNIYKKRTSILLILNRPIDPNQSKFQILFHKNRSPLDFITRTLRPLSLILYGKHKYDI